jgi:uncharacterized protein GlcG (DUF336 family)
VSDDLFTTKLAMTLTLAKSLADVAAQEIANRKFSMFVVIVGEDAAPLLVHRVNDAQLGSYDVAVEKARSALKFRRPTKVWEDRIAKESRNQFLSLPGLCSVEGGLPLVVNGKTIGAVGLSGGTSAEDGEVGAVVVAAFQELIGKSGH